MGKTTKMSIQSGIYHAQLGLIEKLINNFTLENNMPTRPVVLATGGFSNLFITDNVFDKVVPELVLLGVKLMLDMN